MWRCSKCGEEVEDDFDVCWNCQTGKDGAVSETYSLAAASKTKGGDDVKVKDAPEVASLMRRYRDAYLEARAVNGYGIFIKVAAIIAALLLSLIGFMIFAEQRGGKSDAAIGLGVVVVGICVGLLFYLIGVLVSAQGQILKASLDSAVNNSPFLTNEHRAKIMSL